MINDANEIARKRPPSVYLGLGANLGNRESNLTEAIKRIKGLGLEVLRASSIYETEPVGYAAQPWFLNQVVELRVDLDVRFHTSPEAMAPLKAIAEERIDVASMFWMCRLLGALLEIEREMGRERNIANGPRVIDIDILLYGDEAGLIAEIRTPFLTIPHPRMHERRFVLEPLAEIAPDLIHPGLKKSCRELLDSLDDPSAVRLYKSGSR